MYVIVVRSFEDDEGVVWLRMETVNGVELGSGGDGGDGDGGGGGGRKEMGCGIFRGSGSRSWARWWRFIRIRNLRKRGREEGKMERKESRLRLEANVRD